MSRHEIPALDADRYTVFVGWDHPLQSFFAQVYDCDAADEDQPILWIGADKPRILYEVDLLAAGVRKYAIISNEMRRTLYSDKDEGR